MGLVDIELWFSGRYTRYFKTALKSDNNIVVRIIINKDFGGFYSVNGINVRLIQEILIVKERNLVKILNHKCDVLKCWNHKCDNECDAVRLSV